MLKALLKSGKTILLPPHLSNQSFHCRILHWSNMDPTSWICVENGFQDKLLYQLHRNPGEADLLALLAGRNDICFPPVFRHLSNCYDETKFIESGLEMTLVITLRAHGCIPTSSLSAKTTLLGVTCPYFHSLYDFIYLFIYCVCSNLSMSSLFIHKGLHEGIFASLWTDVHGPLMSKRGDPWILSRKPYPMHYSMQIF